MADNSKKGSAEVISEEEARLTSEVLQDLEDDQNGCPDIPAPPDGGYGWVIVFASFMCNMIVDGIAYTFGVFLEQFVDYFKEGKGKVAWVGSLLSGVYLSAGPVVSALANKYGCRRVCIAGSVIACVAFVLSTFSTSINVLMLTYGVMGGFGFGMIYLPAVVAVGYYFETKRSLATGIAVCGSGFGTFVFAPLATYLLEKFDWKNSLLIFAGLILNCAIFGAMMRPLTFKKAKLQKPLMQRMYEEKRFQMERGSIAGSFFVVQLPDGTMERRMKMPINADPGVHSSLNLDQLASQHLGGTLNPIPTLPSIAEAKMGDILDLEASCSQVENVKQRRIHHNSDSENTSTGSATIKNMQRNASQPAFSSQNQAFPKNGSVPSFDRVRKTSQGERYKPTLSSIRSASRGDVKAEDGSSKVSLNLRTDSSAKMVRPLSRKDIFYSGSVTNLREYQSQKSLTNYRNSVISLTKYEKNMRELQGDNMVDIELQRNRIDLCPCLALPDSFKSALSTMLDVSLLKDPVFMLIGISNVFGMAGLYVPFVYLVDSAVKAGIDQSSASLLLSIIGITNTFGRVVCGYVADFPSVDSLLMNNICLVISTIAVAATPLCGSSYAAYVTMSIFFGIAVSGYISLTSIILVDLLGLDKLTNAFGLLILFRGAAAIVGSPLAGAVYDATGKYDVPFYMAAVFFGISAITSFLAPCMKRFSKPIPIPEMMENLPAINEEPSEDVPDDDEPITMCPRIVRTLPSPHEEQPDYRDSLMQMSTKDINQPERPSNVKNIDQKALNLKKKNPNEIRQIESVL